MASDPAELGKRGEVLLQRLAARRAELADQSPEGRRALLRGLINEELDHVARVDHTAYLAGVILAAGVAAGGAAGGGGGGEIVEVLRQAERASGRSAALMGGLAKALGESEAAGQGLDPAAALELCAELAEFVGWLDDYVWRSWREQIAPSTRMARPGVMRQTGLRLLRGDPGASRQKLREDLTVLKRLVGSTIASISRAGKNYASRHLMKYGVEAIEMTVSGGWGKEAKCWAKYKEMAGGMTAEMLEVEVMQEVTRAARELAEAGMAAKPQ